MGKGERVKGKGKRHQTEGFLRRDEVVLSTVVCVCHVPKTGFRAAPMNVGA
jgi:hypothetical protein